VDAWAFERVLADAEEAWAERSGKGDRRRAVSLFTKAAALYAGLFLPQDTDELWSIRYREQLRSKFRRGIERLCRHLEETERWEEAADNYQKALEVDPIAEAFHRRLMRCYQWLGRSADAVAAYERCRKILAAELGVRPSAETEAALREVQAG
jgi:DNA-binding SARP family transcriptional activator